MARTTTSTTTTTTTTLLLLATTLTTLTPPASAQGPTGSDRSGSGQCPSWAIDGAGYPRPADATWSFAEVTMVYSPFTPYSAYPSLRGRRQNCWVAADCVLEAAGESRKQQFAATALVMGLVPLTLRDIAWPERRVVFVTRRLAVGAEIVVLALGLLPVVTGSRRITQARHFEGVMMARTAWACRRVVLLGLAAVCFVALFLSYAALAVAEIYSKRNALGCVFPVWIAVWHIVALLPAAIHTLFAKFRRRRLAKHKQGSASRGLLDSDRGERSGKGGKGGQDATAADGVMVSQEDADAGTSAIQGAGEDWPVQISWAIYYSAGTLIYTSIMAVTVIELVVWVGLGFALTGSSKILAYLLCLLSEETGGAMMYNELELQEVE
ncbi:hypothetical protein ACN47E_007116 [Coniothyrium glycines]